MKPAIFWLLNFENAPFQLSGEFRGPWCDAPFELNLILWWRFLTIHKFCFSKTSKFRHSLTITISFSSPLRPPPELCPWIPMGDNRGLLSPRLCPFSHILNTLLFQLIVYGLRKFGLIFLKEFQRYVNWLIDDYKKLSYRRETARQLPTWREGGARPSRPLWLHPCVWLNPKATAYVHQACRL